VTPFRRWLLPAFLALLALIVAAAVVARVRAYNDVVARTDARTAETATEVAASDPVHRARSGAIMPADPIAPVTAAPTDTGVIVETDGTETTPAATSRAQRFRELLAAPLPAASRNASTSAAPVPPPTPQPKPEPQSTFSKLVTPIVNAVRSIGGSSEKTKSISSASQQQQPATKQPVPNQPATETNPPADPNDKTSDSIAPQLLGVEFSPPQVQDGQDALLIITATDNLSGVRNISGSVTSPTGKALQGFSAQHEGEGARYIGHIQVPRDAEEGAWHINFLSLSDNASNTVHVTYAQSGLLQNAILRVSSSRPDSTPPTVKTVWLERRAMNAGEKNTVFVQAVDDKSGVQLVTGVMLSPSGLARLGFGCHATDNDIWACELTTPKKLDCGEWKIEQIQLQDKANNMGTERGAAVTGVRLQIMSEACDSTPPEMRSFVLDPLTIGNSGKEVVHVTAIVTDDNSGVASISGQAAGPTAPGQEPPRAFFSLRPTGDGQTWIGEIVVPVLAAKGTWSVMWVSALDDARNSKSYSRNDPVLANAAFQVR